MPYPAVQTADFALITPSTNGRTVINYYGVLVGGTSGQTKSVNLISSRGTTALVTVPTGTTIWAKISGVRTTNTTSNVILLGLGPA